MIGSAGHRPRNWILSLALHGRKEDRLFDFTCVTLQSIFECVKNKPVAEELFGEIKGEVKVQTEELSVRYRKLIAVCHPDRYRSESPAVLAMANEATKTLNALREEARIKISRGTYGQKLAYSKGSPVSFSTKNGQYNFIEKLVEGKIVELYFGNFINNSGGVIPVVAKIAKSASDNDLLQREKEVFACFEDPKNPIIVDKIIYKGRVGLIMRHSTGVDLAALLAQNPSGLEPRHVAWIILEALFSLGNLHSKMVVHGSIALNNTILDLSTRKVYFCDFFFAVAKPKDDERISGACENFSAPEVYKKSKPLPAMDIYSIGKLAIGLLGGDVSSKVLPSQVPQKMCEMLGLMVEEDCNKRPGDAWRLCEKWDLMSEKLFGADYRKAAWTA